VLIQEFNNDDLLYLQEEYVREFAPVIVPCTECGERPGEPERFGRCLSCFYDFPPPVSCGRCGTDSWAMEEGWYCARCWPDGPWEPGFGPDDDCDRRDPLTAARVKALIGATLGVPADDVVLV